MKKEILCSSANPDAPAPANIVTAIKNNLIGDINKLLAKYTPDKIDWKLVNYENRAIGEVLALIALLQRILEENCDDWFIFEDLKTALYSTRQGNEYQFDLPPRPGREWIDNMHDWEGDIIYPEENQ